MTSRLKHKGDERLAVARCAAKLFLDKGFAATSGSDIAAAAGLSERTIWRYFRNKESCVAPLYAKIWNGFAEQLSRWPREASIEDHLDTCYDLENQTSEEIADGVLMVRLIAAMPEEPDLRAFWLLSYHDGEDSMATVIADRLNRSKHDFEVRLCAAAVMGAVRTIDETISMAAMRDGQTFTRADLVARMSQAIRAVSNLPFCDPVRLRPFGDMPAIRNDQPF